MARIWSCHALDDQRRGSFDLIGIIDCICGSWATSDPQYVQPRLQEQGTDITEHDDSSTGSRSFMVPIADLIKHKYDQKNKNRK